MKQQNVPGPPSLKDEALEYGEETLAAGTYMEETHVPALSQQVRAARLSALPPTMESLLLLLGVDVKKATHA